MARIFEEIDIDRTRAYPMIHARNDDEFEERLLWWHKKGLQQTASGYGSKLTTTQGIWFRSGNGRKPTFRRVYVTIYSNAGTAWITVNGERIVIE